MPIGPGVGTIRLMTSTQRVRLALLALAVVVLIALIGPESATARCIVDAACDCETIGSGPIRQPLNAWSALAIAMVGVVLLRSARGPWIVAWGTVGAGVAAFLYHASLADWASRLDGVAVAGIGFGAAISLTTMERRWLLAVPAASLTAIAAVTRSLIGPLGAIAAALAAAMLIVRHRSTERQVWIAITASMTLAGGLVMWFASRSGGPWCRPHSLMQGHAAWHLMASAGLALLHRYLASGRGALPPTVRGGL